MSVDHDHGFSLSVDSDKSWNTSIYDLVKRKHFGVDSDQVSAEIETLKNRLQQRSVELHRLGASNETGKAENQVLRDKLQVGEKREQWKISRRWCVRPRWGGIVTFQITRHLSSPTSRILLPACVHLTKEIDFETSASPAKIRANRYFEGKVARGSYIHRIHQLPVALASSC